MTDTLRTRLARTALDTTDSVAIVAAGAAAGLTAYRTLTTRRPETRITLALAAGTLAAVLTDHHAYKALAPLRRRLGAEHHAPAREATAAPTREQLAADICADAAHRAAFSASRLDHSGGSLTKADNWTGASDGTATCELTSTAHLLCVPRPTDSDGYSRRTYLLVQGEEQPVEVRSISDLVALLDVPAAAVGGDEAEGDDPWVALGRDLAIAELRPADTATDDQVDQVDEDDNRDQEAEAWADGSL
ncbi:hypothetical protein [Kitasatospora aureofaciens]|uniref:hypothetical protein n=1 Tax=Kitasatospora aureofaciens TaxID=1894 RepID=UPI0033C94F95